MKLQSNIGSETQGATLPAQGVLTKHGPRITYKQRKCVVYGLRWEAFDQG